MADRGRHNGRGTADPSLIAALAGGATVRDAAMTAGVAERTVYRRLADPAFRERIDEAQREMIARASAMLVDASVQAVETLRALLGSDLDFARLAAARAILELGRRMREHEDLAERIAALEQKAGKGDGSWKPRAV